MSAAATQPCVRPTVGRTVGRTHARKYQARTAPSSNRASIHPRMSSMENESLARSKWTSKALETTQQLEVQHGHHHVDIIQPDIDPRHGCGATLRHQGLVKQTRQRWLGKTLRLDPSREIYQLLKAQHEGLAERYEGSIFNDIPTATATFKATFPHLVKLAHSPEWNKIIKRGDTHIRPPSAKRGTARTRKIASTTTSTPSEDESQGRTHLNTIGYRTVLRHAASKYSHISIE